MRRLVILWFVSLVGCAAGEAATPASSPSAPMQPGAMSGGAALKDEAKMAADAPASPPAQQSTPTNGATKSAPEQAPREKQAERPVNRDLIIYTASYSVAVYQVDQGVAAIERIANEQGGYLAVKKDHEITIRVPRGHFEAALAGVDKIGDVLHRDIEALDVTDEHVDLEIRIKNARAVQKQLTELLAKAQVKEALEIEKELARVTEELERLEGKLKLLNDKVAFSTISVTFEARGNAMATQRVRMPFPWLSSLGLPNLLQLSEDK